MAGNTGIVALLAAIALVIELVSPSLCSYTFVLDPLTAAEVKQIVLSPFSLAAMLMGILAGISRPAKRSSVARRLRNGDSILGGMLMSFQAGVLEEVQFRWLLQPIAMVTISKAEPSSKYSNFFKQS